MNDPDEAVAAQNKARSNRQCGAEQDSDQEAPSNAAADPFQFDRASLLGTAVTTLKACHACRLVVFSHVRNLVEPLSQASFVANRSSHEQRRVLDFGCGCGRLTRYLGLCPQYRTIGSDVNPDHIAWCSHHLSNVTSICNGPRPPLSLPDGSIDFVYSLSAFSHLPEHAARAWLHDLARVLAPGGILIITTHGPTALNIIKPSRVHHEMIRLNEVSTQAMIDRLRTERLIFVPYENAILQSAKAGEEYGNTFIAPDKAQSLWSDLFETLTFQPGGLRVGKMPLCFAAEHRSSFKPTGSETSGRPPRF